jgi:AcrR family transcriptional regulator
MRELGGRTGRDQQSGTKPALIRSALEAFSVSGYEAVSVREIERRAGVNRGLAAYHFGTKLGLWRAAIDFLVYEFGTELDDLRGSLDELSPEERGRSIVKVYVEFAARRPEFFLLLTIEGRVHNERSAYLFERFVSPISAFFEEVSGLASSPREQLATEHFILMGAASLIFAVPAQCEYLYGFNPTEEWFVERFAEAAAGLVSARPAPARPGDAKAGGTPNGLAGNGRKRRPPRARGT